MTEQDLEAIEVRSRREANADDAGNGIISRRSQDALKLCAEVRRLRTALTRSEQAHAADSEVCAEVRGQLRADNQRLRAVLRQVGDVWLAINRSEPNPDAIAVSLKNVARAMCDEVDTALSQEASP